MTDLPTPGPAGQPTPDGDIDPQLLQLVQEMVEDQERRGVYARHDQNVAAAAAGFTAFVCDECGLPAAPRRDVPPLLNDEPQYLCEYHHGYEAGYSKADDDWYERREQERGDRTPALTPPWLPPDFPGVRTARRARRRTGGRRAAFADAEHYRTWLRGAMEVLHTRGKEITKPAVAEVFRQTREPGVRRCDDRRLRSWCVKWAVDFDALATEITGPNVKAPVEAPPSFVIEWQSEGGYRCHE